MDSQDKNEPNIRQREETLARRLGQALDQLNPGGAGNCPDAEVIAAYAEQALAPDESTEWEGHFATCARCRNILRVLAASVETPLAEKEVAQLGKLVSAVRAPVEITAGSAGHARPKKISNWPMRWLAPALGVAAVLTVWFALRPPWRSSNQGATQILIAQAPREEMPASPAPPPAEEFSKAAPQLQQSQKKEPAPLADHLPGNSAPLNSPMNVPAKGSADAGATLDQVAPGAGAASGSLQERKKLSAQPEAREMQPSANPAAPPLPSSALGAMEAPAAPQSDAKAKSSVAVARSVQAEASANGIANTPSRDKQAATLQAQAGATPGAAIRQETLSDLQSGARNPQALAVIRPAQNFSVLLKAPSSSNLWRVGTGGTIQRSTDAGKNWTSQVSPSPEDWLVGAAVSDTSCWLAGRNGAIARTVDGEHWERVAPPAIAMGADGKLPDWTGVVARDSQSVTITSGDGRKFTTADAGKTWLQQ